MKRLLAFILALVLLCGQMAFADSEPEYTRGWEINIGDIVIRAGEKEFKLTPSFQIRLIATEETDQAQFSVGMEKNGKDMFAIWADEMQDGSGNLTFSNSKTRYFLPADSIKVHNLLIEAYDADFGLIQRCDTLAEALNQWDILFTSDESEKDFIQQHSDEIQILTENKIRIMIQEMEMEVEKLADNILKVCMELSGNETAEAVIHARLFIPDGPLFDLSDKTPELLTVSDIWDTEEMNKAIMESVYELMQDESVAELIAYYATMNTDEADQDESPYDLFEKGEYEKAFPKFYVAAASGDSNAAYAVGYMFYFGCGVAQNSMLARLYFEKAAENQVPAALQMLGYIYEIGDNVPVDLEKAFMYNQKAAELGDVYGMYNLGLMYAFGKYVEKDLEQARVWLTKAADGGVEDAVHTLGLLDLEEQGNQMEESAGEGEANNMMHMDIVNALREAGIDIPDKTLAEIETSWAEWNQYYTERNLPPVDYYGEQFPSYLLMWLGMGDTDDETGIWTPSSSDVYAFDAERDDISNMYAVFLQGIASIVPGFEPNDVQEKTEESESALSFEEKMERAEKTGIYPADGITTVSFVLNGHSYERELGYYGDWIDENVIGWINEVLETEGFSGRIHCFDDVMGGQGFILVYGDDEYGRKIQEILGKPERGTAGK